MIVSVGVNKNNIRSARVASVLLVVLNVLDVISTHKSLSIGNVESNPIVRQFVHNSFLFWSIKIIVPMCVLLYVWLRPPHAMMFVYSVWLCVFLYIIVVLHNFIA